MSIEFGSICDFITAMAAAFGVGFSLITWRRNTKFEKAKSIKDFFREMYEAPDTVEVFRKIDYDKKWYGRKFHDSEFEGKVDKVFIRFTYFIDLLNEGCVDIKKSNWINYEIHRILSNHDTQAYLFNLRNFANSRKLPFPYKSLVDYGKHIGILDETFFNVELGEKKYVKILNW